MGELSAIRRVIQRFPSGAAIAYAGLVLLLIAATWNEIADIVDRSADFAATREILDRLDERGRAPGTIDNTADATPLGSPLLEGPTVTVAGASLLQRVTDAVMKFGGTVLSSQVELQGSHAKAGFVGVVTNCEIDQLSLQKLLYDLEAGMPFLFIDQLVIQVPVRSSTNGDERLQILLSVSGRWRGSK